MCAQFCGCKMWKGGCGDHSLAAAIKLPENTFSRYVKRFLKFLICIAIIVLLNFSKLLSVDKNPHFVPPALSPERTQLNSAAESRHVLFTEGCKIPLFNPFDTTVAKFYSKTIGDVPCPGKRYLTVVNNTVVLDAVQVEKDFPGKKFTCTYLPILRNPKNNKWSADNRIGYGKQYKLNFEKHLKSEFVKITCLVKSKIAHVEYLATTPIKPEVKTRCEKNSKNSIGEPKLDVLIVGIDSVSKLNFNRHFKLTSEYLSKNLTAFEFHGYIKVADNTFPNVTPLLTGHFAEYYYNETNRHRYFDDLDFIWKDYTSIGYKTFFAEDAPHMGIFNYVKQGFKFPPTDYYLRPFVYALEDTKWKRHSKRDCLQGNPEILVIFDYLRSFLSTTGFEPYFALTWPTRLTHNEINKAGYADKAAFDLLRDINEMGILNRSMLIFLSDHGIRFGDIRETFIGKYEERMPFMFATVPSWFLQKHPDIARNLKTNQRRMTTPFDLHATFSHVYQMMSGRNESETTTQYGISLFDAIPPERTCEDAHILPHWCPCHRFVKKETNDSRVSESALVLIETLNNWTESHRDVCVSFDLDAVVDALASIPKTELVQLSGFGEENDENSVIFDKDVEIEDYMITVRTVPGRSLFESTVRYEAGSFRVLDVSRIDEYGHHGDCVNDSRLRKYCYCKEKEIN